MSYRNEMDLVKIHARLVQQAMLFDHWWYHKLVLVMDVAIILSISHFQKMFQLQMCVAWAIVIHLRKITTQHW